MSAVVVRLPATLEDVNLVVVHPGDENAAGAIEHLAALEAVGLARPFLVWRAGPVVAGDIPVETVSGGARTTGPLLDVLARQRRLRRLRIAVVLADGDVRGKTPLLDRATVDLGALLVRIAGVDTVVIELRVLATEFDEAVTASDLFVPNAHGNVVLIPHDRSSDLSTARPVLRSTPHVFDRHVATELASLLGAWVAMDSSPVDSWPAQPGGAHEPTVRFVRSITRSIVCPALPLDEVLPFGEPLPVPDGFQPAHDASTGVARAADAVLPSGFLFETSSMESAFRRVTVRRALADVPREFGRTLISLPRIFRHGVTRDVQSLFGDALQDMVGRDAWLQVIWLDRQEPDDERRPWEQLALDTIERLEADDHRQLLSDVPADVWTNLVVQTLGLVDGDPRVDDLRQSLADRRILFPEPAFLAPAPLASAGSTANQLLGTEEAGDDGEHGSTVVTTTTRLTVWTTDSADPADLDLSGNVPGPGWKQVFDEVTETERDDELITALAGEGGAMPIPRGGVLGQVARRLARQARRADMQLSEMVSTLRVVIDDGLGERNPLRIPRWMKFLFGLCLGVLAFSWITFTAAVKPARLGWISGDVRNVLFALATLCVLTPAVALLLALPKSKRTGALITAAGVMAVAVLLAWLPSLRFSPFARWLTVPRRWPAIPLSIGVVVVTLIAQSLTDRTTGTWRGSLARFNRWALWLYVFVGLTVSAASLYSFWRSTSTLTASELGIETTVNRISDSTRRLLLVLATIVTLVVMASIVTWIALQRLRERYRVNQQRQLFEYAIDEARRASFVRRRVRLLIPQWLGTAAVLSRLVWRPLGDHRSGVGPERERLVNDDALLKHDVASLELSDSGRQQLVDRLTASLVRPGWLNEQYELIVREFAQGSRGGSIGAEVDRTDLRPETCPSTTPLSMALQDQGRGRRWDFASGVYRGDFDEVLASTLTGLDPSVLFGAIIADPRLHRTGGTSDDALDVATFLREIAPQGTQELPPRLVDRLFAPGDPENRMESTMWWPGRVVEGPAASAAVRPSLAEGVGGDAVIQAVRVDVSPGYLLSSVHVAQPTPRPTAGKQPKPPKPTSSTPRM